MKENKLAFILFLSLFFFLSPLEAAELKQGRYFGTLELLPSKNKIAVVADFYLESPSDPRLFPALHAAIKLTLGGFNTHEYINEVFDSIRYDFESGDLTLDGPANDLFITAKAESLGENIQIIGDVFIKSSAVFGKLSLIYETDEPGDLRRDSPREEEFISLLDGQYEGFCEKDNAVLQIQTVRGLKTAWQGEEEVGSFSRYYGISARLGLKDPVTCSNILPNKPWCNYFTYGGGSYNAFQGKLQLKGEPATEDCTVQKNVIKCEIRQSGWSKSCEFQKKNSSIKAPKFFTRSFNLYPTPEQNQELPVVHPPQNSELSEALRGVFSGYLHNETNNSYQYMQLVVLPFSFTENSHNPNKMMVSTSARLFIGVDGSQPFITQQFLPRSFYLRPGFTLSASNTDTFINITEWKKGFIRGILYSHAFGKVGTVQLVKSVATPLPVGLERVRSFAGEFEDSSQWFRFLFPTQPNLLTDHLIRFSGSYLLYPGSSTVSSFERGTFDPFTGVFGWVIGRERVATFSNGFVDKDNHIQIHIPPTPGAFGVNMGDYLFKTFKRK